MKPVYKTILFSMLLLAFMNNSIAQNKTKFKISSPMKCIFLGLENSISVINGDKSKHDYELQINDTLFIDVKKTGPNSFNLTPNKNIPKAEIILVDKISKKIEPLTFYVKSPELTLPSSISIDDLERTQFLKLDLDFNNLGYTVVRYKCTCLGKHTAGPQSITVNSAYLNDCRSILNKLGSGDFIMFSEILGKTPSGRLFEIENYTGQIK